MMYRARPVFEDRYLSRKVFVVWADSPAEADAALAALIRRTADRWIREGAVAA